MSLYLHFLVFPSIKFSYINAYTHFSKTHSHSHTHTHSLSLTPHTASLTKDSLKDIPALPNELDKESKPSDSASAQERKPPPRRRPPPRPVVSKMISLPSYLSPTNRRSLGEERKTSLPLVSSKGNVSNIVV